MNFIPGYSTLSLFSSAASSASSIKSIVDAVQTVSEFLGTGDKKAEKPKPKGIDPVKTTASRDFARIYKLCDDCLNNRDDFEEKKQTHWFTADSTEIYSFHALQYIKQTRTFNNLIFHQLIDVFSAYLTDKLHTDYRPPNEDALTDPKIFAISLCFTLITTLDEKIQASESESDTLLYFLPRLQALFEKLSEDSEVRKTTFGGMSSLRLCFQNAAFMLQNHADAIYENKARSVLRDNSERCEGYFNKCRYGFTKQLWSLLMSEETVSFKFVLTDPSNFKALQAKSYKEFKNLCETKYQNQVSVKAFVTNETTFQFAKKYLFGILPSKEELDAEQKLSKEARRAKIKLALQDPQLKFLDPNIRLHAGFLDALATLIDLTRQITILHKEMEKVTAIIHGLGESGTVFGQDAISRTVKKAIETLNETITTLKELRTQGVELVQVKNITKGPLHDAIGSELLSLEHSMQKLIGDKTKPGQVSSFMNAMEKALDLNTLKNKFIADIDTLIAQHKSMAPAVVKSLQEAQSDVAATKESSTGTKIPTTTTTTTTPTTTTPTTATEFKKPLAPLMYSIKVEKEVDALLIALHGIKVADTSFMAQVQKTYNEEHQKVGENLEKKWYQKRAVTLRFPVVDCNKPLSAFQGFNNLLAEHFADIIIGFIDTRGILREPHPEKILALNIFLTYIENFNDIQLADVYSDTAKKILDEFKEVLIAVSKVPELRKTKFEAESFNSVVIGRLLNEIELFCATKSVRDNRQQIHNHAVLLNNNLQETVHTLTQTCVSLLTGTDSAELDLFSDPKKTQVLQAANSYKDFENQSKQVGSITDIMRRTVPDSTTFEIVKPLSPSTNIEGEDIEAKENKAAATKKLDNFLKTSSVKTGSEPDLHTLKSNVVELMEATIRLKNLIPKNRNIINDTKKFGEVAASLVPEDILDSQKKIVDNLQKIVQLIADIEKTYGKIIDDNAPKTLPWANKYEKPIKVLRALNEKLSKCLEASKTITDRTKNTNMLNKQFEIALETIESLNAFDKTDKAQRVLLGAGKKLAGNVHPKINPASGSSTEAPVTTAPTIVSRSSTEVPVKVRESKKLNPTGSTASSSGSERGPSIPPKASTEINSISDTFGIDTSGHTPPPPPSSPPATVTSQLEGSPTPPDDGKHTDSKTSTQTPSAPSNPKNGISSTNPRVVEDHKNRDTSIPTTQQGTATNLNPPMHLSRTGGSTTIPTSVNQQTESSGVHYVNPNSFDIDMNSVQPTSPSAPPASSTGSAGNSNSKTPSSPSSTVSQTVSSNRTDSVTSQTASSSVTIRSDLDSRNSISTVDSLAQTHVSTSSTSRPSISTSSTSSRSSDEEFPTSFSSMAEVRALVERARLAGLADNEIKKLLNANQILKEIDTYKGKFGDSENEISSLKSRIVEILQDTNKLEDQCKLVTRPGVMLIDEKGVSADNPLEHVKQLNQTSAEFKKQIKQLESWRTTTVVSCLTGVGIFWLLWNEYSISKLKKEYSAFEAKTTSFKESFKQQFQERIDALKALEKHRENRLTVLDQEVNKLITIAKPKIDAIKKEEKEEFKQNQKAYEKESKNALTRTSVGLMTSESAENLATKAKLEAQLQTYDKKTCNNMEKIVLSIYKVLFTTIQKYHKKGWEKRIGKLERAMKFVGFGSQLKLIKKKNGGDDTTFLRDLRRSDIDLNSLEVAYGKTILAVQTNFNPETVNTYNMNSQWGEAWDALSGTLADIQAWSSDSDAETILKNELKEEFTHHLESFKELFGKSSLTGTLTIEKVQARITYKIGAEDITPQVLALRAGTRFEVQEPSTQASTTPSFTATVG